MRPGFCHFSRLLLVIFIGGSSACGVWKKDIRPQATPPPPAAVASGGNKPAPVPQAVRRRDLTETWVFQVDPRRSTGKINLKFDPKGSLLGQRPAQDTAPMTGRILLSVRSGADGTRTINFKDVQLTNTAALVMPFQWARLVGRMTVNIPVKVLRINPHSFHQPTKLQRNGSFRLPQNYFTVRGNADVVGSGLVLSKAVGKRNVDLTIRKTGKVQVDGSLITKNGVTTLRIPSAVMKDRFDMEGSMLDLVFTGDIVATRQVQ